MREILDSDKSGFPPGNWGNFGISTLLGCGMSEYDGLGSHNETSDVIQTRNDGLKPEVPQAGHTGSATGRRTRPDAAMSQDDVLSLSAVYGLTLNRKQKDKKIKKNSSLQFPGGSTPDLRLNN